MTIHVDHDSPALEGDIDVDARESTNVVQGPHPRTSPETIITTMVERVLSETSCDAIAALYGNRFLSSVNIKACHLTRCPETDHLHLREGPGRYVLDHGEPIRIADTKWTLRWPRWAKQVAKQGFRSTLSMGLRTKTRTYGSLTLFDRSPGAFTPHDVATVTPLLDDAILALAAAAQSNLDTAPEFAASA